MAAEIVQALSEQSVVVLGTQAASIVLPRMAQQLAALRRQREEVAKEVERLVLAHPLHPVLTSMPGVGVRTAARLLIDVVTRAFASAGHLAAYAGLAPVTRRSGSSIRGEHPSRRGNKQLKRAMFLSAFAALRDPISRAYYERKISQGKRPQPSSYCACAPALRCVVCHAARRDPVQPAAARNFLDKHIGAPQLHNALTICARCSHRVMDGYDRLCAAVRHTVEPAGTYSKPLAPIQGLEGFKTIEVLTTVRCSNFINGGSE